MMTAALASISMTFLNRFFRLVPRPLIPRGVETYILGMPCDSASIKTWPVPSVLQLSQLMMTEVMSGKYSFNPKEACSRGYAIFAASL